MSKSAFERSYTVKTSGLNPGRHDVEIVDAEFFEKVVLYTPEAKDAGIVGKEFGSLNDVQRKIVLDSDRVSKDGRTVMPKVADRIVLHLKEPKSGIIMKWNSGYVIEMPYWQNKDKATGEVADENSFVNEPAAPLGKEFYELVGRVLGRETPTPGSAFTVGDLIKPGDKLNIEVEKDNKGYARAKKGSAEPIGYFGVATPTIESTTPQAGSQADLLLKALQTKRDVLNGKPKGDVTMVLRELVTSKQLDMDFPTAMNTWVQVRDQVIAPDGTVAL